MKNNIKIFQNLFIFELANNHQGSVSHGKKIIEEMAKISKEFNLNAAVKFQYRQLNTFIHPEHRKNSNAKHINRFLSTELSQNDFLELVNYAKANSLKTVVTPFDEESVDIITKHKVDIIKIASCSCEDWPLLIKVVKKGKPVICSTGGLDYRGIDNLYSFFSSKSIDFAFLHCVGIYPTPRENLNLSAISNFIERYPGVPIGYSGHEDPNDTLPIALSISRGAIIFERHVGLPLKNYPLNSYSMNSDQVKNWIKTALNSWQALGRDKVFNLTESSTLLTLKRGVFASKNIKKGTILKADDVFFAMPCEKNQLDSGKFGKVRTRYIASKNYKTNEAIFEDTVLDQYHIIREIVHDIQAILRKNKIVLNENMSAEISHHYGIKHFKQTGLFIVNVINVEYCKKILVMLPGQTHPEQFHKKKKETFHVLKGSLNLKLNGIEKKLQQGDVIAIESGVKHMFYTDNECIIEEISSTHFRNDSFYLDDKINSMDPLARKTIINNFNV